MDIVEIRRANLRRWVAEHGTPPKEKSLFSQLKSTGSFGERVARRLEEQYRMGYGYLDRSAAQPQPALASEDEGFIVDTPVAPSGAVGVQVGDGPVTVPIRAVKLRLQAGVSGFVAEPDMEIDHGYFQVPKEVIDQLGLNPEDLIVTSVKGRSMEPMMFEDDKVLVDTSKRRPKDNECFAVNWNGEPIVKCLIKKSDHWCLYSFNRKFESIDVRSGQCSIIGMVVWQPARIVVGRL